MWVANETVNSNSAVVKTANFKPASNFDIHDYAIHHSQWK